ncbi:MAG: [acyl-carrier-protein] S-malonyltransferase [Oceanicaulis sp.]|uniref:ACP S-malonyltransferase n=1 Tax=Oceanicaulis TaxID=153232 RepID=UPI000C0AA294|nr:MULTISPECIES: ACP S-malonyltransferase [Oceanicaulis]MAP48668.1 [acyl-carrier-protein] S-malonyltransferase [Oceanicaulis sp.]|tara:strand:- start:1831 stop:2772 length:942 start_codon:yes stop_codon:yes gene_type:complete
MALAFTFPGQGSQAVGMGKALADSFASARAVFDEVDEALGQNLSQLMWDGPIEEITLTENAQPAIMAVSLAAMAALKSEFDVDVTAAKFVAGHSLGEYSALCAAGALSVSDAAKLLKLRGQSMQKAVPVGQGAMAALLGAEMDQAEQAITQAATSGIVTIANDNAPGQIVISGDKSAVDAAIAAIKEMGVRKAMLLPVSAPFHCPLMQPAADAMAEALKDAQMSNPSVPVVTNVSAGPVSDAETLRAQLVEQVTGKVRWRESVDAMHAAGVEQFVEAGAKVLTTMLKRHIKEAQGTALVTAEDLEAFAASLKG